MDKKILHNIILIYNVNNLSRLFVYFNPNTISLFRIALISSRLNPLKYDTVDVLWLTIIMVYGVIILIYIY